MLPIDRRIYCFQIFVGDLLCVSSKVQGLGLGSEMVRRSMDIARERGHTHYMTCASGKEGRSEVTDKERL